MSYPTREYFFWVLLQEKTSIELSYRRRPLYWAPLQEKTSLLSFSTREDTSIELLYKGGYFYWAPLQERTSIEVLLGRRPLSYRRRLLLGPSYKKKSCIEFFYKRRPLLRSSIGKDIYWHLLRSSYWKVIYLGLPTGVSLYWGHPTEEYIYWAFLQESPSISMEPFYTRRPLVISPTREVLHWDLLQEKAYLSFFTNEDLYWFLLLVKASIDRRRPLLMYSY